jgi:hypothetical protein
MTPPHDPRARRGTRGRRRRRCGLHSLGRARPESTRPQLAQRMTAMAQAIFGSVDSSDETSSVRAASTTEDDGDEDVGERDPCVEIASVTLLRRRARKRACRTRPDARPSGVRAYVRLASRRCARRRSPEHGAQRAPTEAHAPQNTFTSLHPPQRPNRPSTASRSPEGLDSRGVRRHREPRRARSPMRPPRRPGSDHPGLHLLRRSLLRRHRPRWR